MLKNNRIVFILKKTQLLFFFLSIKIEIKMIFIKELML